jgi:hypothetical protein
MIKKSYYGFLMPVLLAVLIFSSNFLNTTLFKFGDMNFAVWFVLSVLCFVCGWIIDQSLGWDFGGKVVFAVLIGTTVISILVIIFFKEYFDANSILVENLILYSLRNIALGAMGLFGMAVVEVLNQRMQIAVNEEKIKTLEIMNVDSKKEAELLLKESKLQAEKIVADADIKAKNIILKKERIEKELKEFIQVERELLKKYEGQG